MAPGAADGIRADEDGNLCASAEGVREAAVL